MSFPSVPNIRIEQVHGVYTVIDLVTGHMRPASTLEVELWYLVIGSPAPARETFIKVSESDFLRLVVESEAKERRIKELDAKVLELTEARIAALPPGGGGEEPPA